MANHNAQPVDLINFTHGPHNNPQSHGRSRTNLNRHSATPDHLSDSDSDPNPDPDRDLNPDTSLTQGRTSAENPGIGSHLEEHAIISARRRKLPAASEEDVLHAARVITYDFPSSHTFTGITQLSAEERSIEIYSMLAVIKCRLDQLGTERSGEERDDYKLPQQLKVYRTSATLPTTHTDDSISMIFVTRPH